MHWTLIIIFNGQITQAIDYTNTIGANIFSTFSVPEQSSYTH